VSIDGQASTKEAKATEEGSQKVKQALKKLKLKPAKGKPNLRCIKIRK